MTARLIHLKQSYFKLISLYQMNMNNSGKSEADPHPPNKGYPKRQALALTSAQKTLNIIGQFEDQAAYDHGHDLEKTTQTEHEP